MKKWLLICLILFLLPFGDIGQLQAAKKDNGAENLNFAPTVDFELKEKKKVDVIVDVGNTAYTVDQVNSYINESLRPQLQASGLDYKIHVEKSSEGNTRQYYLGRNSAGINDSSVLWVYDTVTGRHEQVLEGNFARTAYYSSNGSGGGFYYYNLGNSYYENPIMSPNEDYFLYRFSTPTSMENYYQSAHQGIVHLVNLKKGEGFGKKVSLKLSGGSLIETNSNGAAYLYLTKKNSLFVPHRFMSDSYFAANINMEDFLVGIEPSYTNDMIMVNDPYRTRGGSRASNVWTTDNGTYLILGSSLYYISNDFNSYFQTGTMNNSKLLTSQTSSPLNSVKLLKESQNVVYTDVTGSSFRKIYSVHVYDPKIDKKYSYTTLSELNSYPNSWVIDDDRIIATAGNKTYLINDFTKDEVEVFQDYLMDIKQVLGNNLFYVKNNMLYTMNIDNKVEKFVLSYNPTLIRYPEWYIAKTRYITDIIDEVPYRAGAEKFYIRLDDQEITHLNNTTRLGKTIEALSKQNIQYISIGNENNVATNTKIQSALGQSKQYSISNPKQAFASLATYITDRKEVDLHVLVGETSLALNTIKTSVDGLVKTMKDKNINVTPHYVVGNASSVLQGLLNDVKWNEDKNNYVLLVQQGKMEDMNIEQTQEEVVNLILGKYAHLLHLGSSNNRVIGEKLVQLLEQNGFYVNGGTLTANLQKTAAYIEQTAVSNPKRISNVLVLQHDPSTGEYSSEITLQTFYDDFESDKKRNERFKTTHDPTVYENHTGVMAGIGQYQEVPTTKFTKVGLYEMVVQVQDEPIADSRLSEYWLWSKDSLSRLKLYVHRQPVAEFSATVNASKKLTITDYSYDLDRYSRVNKGITTWEWKWKKVEDSHWTEGSPPQTLAANTDYLISLKVKDIDAAWSNETIRFVTTNPYNQPPVALFTVEPAMISHRATSTIKDLSYDPDGDAIISREWIVKKDDVELWNATTQPTVAQLKTAATGKGLSVLGTYILQLRVQDAQNQFSEWAKGSLEVVNYPPIADFEPLTETYRDTLNKVTNLTKNPDFDGDTVSYEWQLTYKGKTYSLGTVKDPSFTIKGLGLGKTAVGTWNLQLKASDPLGAYSYMSYDFDVVNQQPTTEITSGRATGYINVPYAYTSSGTDPDSEDISSLQSYWKLTTPSGKVHQWYTKDISITYTEKGDFTLDHWVVDQLGAKSFVKTMKIRVLNMLPIPGFKMNPNPTYREENVSIVSEATDYDGYIEEHKYYVTLPNGTTGLLSDLADFKRIFSTVGKLQIRQVVTDNDGASAEITKELEILNRKPVADITTPAGRTAATATKMQPKPRIEWTYTDADSDPQTRYNVVVRNAAGQQIYATGAVTSSSKAIQVPASVTLEDYVIYNVSVQVFDGYDWSDWSSLKYFYIVTNQPPVAGFTCVPNPAYEGDTINCTNTSVDPDGDEMTYVWTVTGPNNYSVTHTTKNISIPKTITENGVGTYTIRLRATDSHGMVNENDAVSSVKVLPLTINGAVNHTAEWETNRLTWNQGNPNNVRPVETFWAGEGFDLVGTPTVTSNTGGSTTVANRIDVAASKIGTLTLKKETAQKWTGYLGQEHTSIDLEKLEDGPYDFVFTVTYSNGVKKTDTVRINIKGNWLEFYRYHKPF